MVCLLKRSNPVPSPCEEETSTEAHRWSVVGSWVSPIRRFCGATSMRCRENSPPTVKGVTATEFRRSSRAPRTNRVIPSAGLLACGSSRHRAFPSHLATVAMPVLLSAYSCGGSHGFERSEGPNSHRCSLLSDPKDGTEVNEVFSRIGFESRIPIRRHR